jgi:hypothetical protein
MTKLFKGPTLPKIESAAPMPDDDGLKKSRRRLIAKEKARAGVNSTLLSKAGSRETLAG